MKKHLVLGALAVLALAACTKSEVVEINKSNEISLTAVSGKNLTKAADGYCNSHKPEDFQVWAATQEKTYFADQKYKKSGTSYIADGAARYWPDGAVDFFAVKNHKGTPTFTNSGTTALAFTDYTVESTPATQKDFIYAVTKGATKTSSPITLNFRHALSQIEFRAKNDNSNIYVVIDTIKVVNVMSKGDFSVNKTTEDKYENHTHDETAETATRTGRCSWSNPSISTSYEITFKDDLGSPKSIDVANGGSADLTVSDPTGKEYNDNTLYLLPQTLTPWDPSTTPKAVESSNSYFIISAIIYNVSGVTVDKNNDVVLWGKKVGTTWQSKPIAVPVPASTTWEDGLRYVYTFNFTSYGTGGSDPGTGDPVLTPITLTVNVDDFVDAGNKDVAVE